MNTSKIRMASWARVARWAGGIATAALLAACGGGGGGGGGGSVSAGDGTLRVALTDAPSCGYDHVWVTVEKVRVHQSSTAADADGGWIDLTLATPKRIDLLALTNGVLEELGSTQLAAGSYQQVRLVLATNTGTGATAEANAVQPTGGAVIPLDTPSAQQSGLKLQANFVVTSGQTVDLVLDFDACSSVVKAGNSGKYNLKPVISVVPRVTSSSIQGFVTTTLALSSTTVSAQQNGVTVRATTPDSSGKFTIPFLTPGSYTLVITSDGRATGVVTGVPVGTTTASISGTSTAIVLPVSAMADVAGTVTATTGTGTATISTAVGDATVRALQALTGGPTIALASKPVDSVLGTYTFRLPVGAPVKGAYSAGGTVVLAPDTAVAGKYTMEAKAPGRAVVTKPADISAGTSVIVNFAY